MATNGNDRNLRRLWLPAALCLLILLAEIYLFNRNVFEPKQKHASAEQLATLKLTQNQVLHKEDGTLVWHSPKDGSALYREDAIATMADSQATVTFADNSELIIEPNSLVILEMAPPVGGGATPGTVSQIVTRLIKGSMKRKNAGKTKILVKLSSDPDAKAAVLDDPHGSAIFRLVHDAEGLRIVIEGGTLTVNGKDLKTSDDTVVAVGPSRLSAPRLRKPSVETKLKKKGGHGMLERMWSVLVPSACAEEDEEEEPAPLQVRIHFDWDEVADANGYLIQISKDPEFSDLALEKKTSDTTFVYEFESPNQKTEYYFRAAAISKSGVIGKYSDPQHVEVLPKKIPVLDRKLVEKKPEEPPPEKKVVKKKPEPEPEPEPEVVVAPAPAPAGPPASFEVAAGAAFQHREFKSKDQQPASSTGSGFVPANARLEVRSRIKETRFFTAGASYLFEVAKRQDVTTTDSKSTPKMATPIWRVYGLYGGRWHSLLVSGGPYATTSSVIGTSGFDYTAQSKVLLGAALRASPHPDESVSFFWTFQLGALASGTTGADLSLSLRGPISGFGQAFRLAEAHGLFWALEGQMRVSKMESSSGGVLEIGYLF